MRIWREMRVAGFHVRSAPQGDDTERNKKLKRNGPSVGIACTLTTRKTRVRTIPQSDSEIDLPLVLLRAGQGRVPDVRARADRA